MPQLTRVYPISIPQNRILLQQSILQPQLNFTLVIKHQVLFKCFVFFLICECDNKWKSMHTNNRYIELSVNIIYVNNFYTIDSNHSNSAYLFLDLLKDILESQPLYHAKNIAAAVNVC